MNVGAANASTPKLAANGVGGIKPAGDFWDGGGQQLPPDQEFNELVEVKAAGGGSKAKLALLILIFFALVGGAWFAYETFVEEKDPMLTIKSLIASLESLLGLSDEEPKDQTPPPPVSTGAPKATSKTHAPDGIVAGNPYWALPNRLLGQKAVLGRMWTTEDEETLRAGLAHKYAYQRWKTVIKIRKMLLSGSDVLLWDAMQDQKFWTRMQAAVGLAEFNVEVSLNSLEAALANARSELQADFFERFAHHPNAGQAFVMRQVVRLMDEKGRLVVLKGIERSHDELRELYLVAGSLDPGKHVQRWAKAVLAQHPPTPGKRKELEDIVNGLVDGDYLIGHKGGPVKKAPEIDDEDEVSSSGDVEFYNENDSGKPEAPDVPDAETFDYEP